MKKKLKYFIIALALALSPALASAQTVSPTYIDAGITIMTGIPPVSVTIGGSQLEFRLDGDLGGAVITGSGGQTLSGQFDIPERVMTPLFSLSVTGDLLNLLNTISAKVGLNLADLLAGGIPVVGIESLNTSAAASNGIAFNTAITGVGFPTTGYFKYIGINAFQQCGELSGSLVIPASVTTIEHHAFQVCGKLTTLDLSGASSLQTIGTSAFDNCAGLIGDLVIPAGVTKIDTYAFYNNIGIRSVAFTGATLDMSTPHRVFSRCSGLEYIDMSSITTNTATAPKSLERPLVETDGYFFADLPAHTVVYLPNGIPTSLITSIPATGNENYVLNASDDTATGTCDWFYVQDGCDYYLPYPFTAAKATWGVSGMGNETTPLGNRAFTKGAVSTAYLPFPFKLPDPTSLRGYALRDKKNTPVEVFRFKQQDPTMEFAANTPYIIRDIVGGSQLPVATNVTVPVTPIGRIKYGADQANGAYDGLTSVGAHSTTITDPDTGAAWGFYGTTETITNALAMSYPWNAWILNSNTWYSVGTQAITPMRAFLYSTDPTATAKPTFELADIDGSTTGIASIDTEEPANSVETRVYNTSGQYLGKDINALPKGLYIVNGKKVVK